MTYATIHLRLSDGRVQSYNIEQPIVLIGRGVSNDLIIPDRTVSANHARLTFKNGRFLLEDLGSTGGTTIDGQPLPPNTARTLKGTEAIRFGGADAIPDSDGIERDPGQADPRHLFGHALGGGGLARADDAHEGEGPGQRIQG